MLRWILIGLSSLLSSRSPQSQFVRTMSDNNDDLEASIRDAIVAALPDASVAMSIEGSCTTGEAKVDLSVTSESFEGLSRLKRHKAVNGVMGGFLEDGGGVHAVTMKCKTPGELEKAG